MPLSLAVYGEKGALSPEVESSFFAKIRLPNGTWKTTYRRRLDDLNELLLAYLPSKRPLELMDVGISSGVSTLEWSQMLEEHEVAHAMVAGDLAVEGSLASIGGWFAVLFEGASGRPLLLEVGSLSVPVQSDRLLARLSHPLLTPLLRAIAMIVGRRRVPLVDVELAARDQVEVVQDDITVPGRYTLCFDVLRAANIVQPAYFDSETLRSLLVNLRDRVKEGGLLVVCRTTEEGVNLATVFRRVGQGLREEATLNGGSEVAEVALSL